MCRVHRTARKAQHELRRPRRLLLRYLQHAVPRFDSLLGRPPHSPSGATSPRPRPGAGPAAGADGVSQLQLARAALRALRRCRPSRRLWQPAPFYGLLRAADPHVRWAGVECVALLAGLVRLRRSWAPLGPAAPSGEPRGMLRVTRAALEATGTAL